MKKKLVSAMLSMLMVVSLGTTCLAAVPEAKTQGPVLELGDIAPRWVAIASISPQFYLESGALHSYLSISPYYTDTIDYVKVTVHIRDVNGSSVKKWSQTLYADVMGDFDFGETYKPASRGKYYMTADISAYKNGKVIDTAEYESSNVTY